MGFLKKLLRKDAPEANYTTVTVKPVPKGKILVSMPNAPDFRGFKRVRLTSHGYDYTEAGVRELLKTNDPEHISGLVDIYVSTPPKQSGFGKFLNVYVSGNHVGFVSNDATVYEEMFKREIIDKVHVRIDGDMDDWNAYMYIHMIGK